MEGKVKLTQCEKIIRHLREYGSISSLEAITDCGILRLASRVSDLKRRGYNIVGETKTGKNRFGESTRFKVDRLIETKEK